MTAGLWCPEYYRAPLRRRKDIISFLKSHINYRGREVDFALAWNVKLYNVNTSFSALVKTWRSFDFETNQDLRLHSREYLRQVSKIFRQMGGEEIFYDEAVNDARRQVTDGDTYRCLWDGTELDVDYAFRGRSGGWLVLSAFAGTPLWSPTYEGKVSDTFLTLDYQDLRNLYRLVVQNDYDFRRDRIAREIEYQAAWALFNAFEIEEIEPPPMRRTLWGLVRAEFVGEEIPGELKGFRRSIGLDDGADPVPWLIMADWLEGEGRDEIAARVRRHIAPEDSP